MTWPDKVDEYIFPEALREKVATAAARGNIVLVQTLRKVLRPTCILETSQIGPHANALVESISSVLAQHSIIVQQSTLAQQPISVQHRADSQDNRPDGNRPSSIDESTRARGRSVRGRGRPRGSRARQNDRSIAPSWNQPTDWTISNPTQTSQSQASKSTQASTESKLEAKKRNQAALPRRKSIDGSVGPKKKRS